MRQWRGAESVGAEQKTKNFPFAFLLNEIKNERKENMSRYIIVLKSSLLRLLIHQSPCSFNDLKFILCLKEQNEDVRKTNGMNRKRKDKRRGRRARRGLNERKIISKAINGKLMIFEEIVLKD
jgi:hypothetical protein